MKYESDQSDDYAGLIGFFIAFWLVVAFAVTVVTTFFDPSDYNCSPTGVESCEDETE